MFSMLAILTYLAAMAIPAWLLRRFGSEAWYWHVLAILGGLAVGLMPTPPALSTPTPELVVGFAFLFLMVWGIGGLAMHRPHHVRHV
jgi:hypothetical protein